MPAELIEVGNYATVKRKRRAYFVLRVHSRLLLIMNGVDPSLSDMLRKDVMSENPLTTKYISNLSNRM